MTVGSGIGGALILEDRIYRGFGKGAGEIGHLRVDRHGSAPTGHLQELEQVASGWAIAKAAQDHASRSLETGGRLGRPRSSRRRPEPSRSPWWSPRPPARATPESASILARAHAAIAFALTQAIALIAPRRIVIGGGVSLIGEEWWFDPIRRLVQQRCLSALPRRIRHRAGRSR